MKRWFYIIIIIFITSLITSIIAFRYFAIINSSENTNAVESISMSDDVSNDTKLKVTKEMAYNGINNYCHKNFDWSIAKENPDIMSVEMGEETGTEYQVIFRSYTGSFVYFYVNKESGKTRLVDYVPAMNIKEESGTINLFDYLDK